MNKRANEAYPVEEIDAKQKYPQYEIVAAKWDTPWFRMMGLQHEGFWCIIRHRDPLTKEILNRPTLAAGPIADEQEALDLVAEYLEYGEPE